MLLKVLIFSVFALTCLGNDSDLGDDTERALLLKMNRQGIYPSDTIQNTGGASC